jgi:signal recognition particle GTPase
VFQEILNRRNLDPEKVSEKIEHIRRTIFEAENYNGSLVRYVIGEVIDRKLGPEQKKDYWQAVLSGHVV